MPIHKCPIGPISAFYEKFYPRNINHIPPVTFFESLDLDPIDLFMDRHYRRSENMVKTINNLVFQAKRSLSEKKGTKNENQSKKEKNDDKQSLMFC